MKEQERKKRIEKRRGEEANVEERKQMLRRGSKCWGEEANVEERKVKCIISKINMSPSSNLWQVEGSWGEWEMRSSERKSWEMIENDFWSGGRRNRNTVTRFRTSWETLLFFLTSLLPDVLYSLFFTLERRKGILCTDNCVFQKEKWRNE